MPLGPAASLVLGVSGSGPLDEKKLLKLIMALFFLALRMVFWGGGDCVYILIEFAVDE